jgi:hypothetical protein
MLCACVCRRECDPGLATELHLLLVFGESQQVDVATANDPTAGGRRNRFIEGQTTHLHDKVPTLRQ